MHKGFRESGFDDKNWSPLIYLGSIQSYKALKNKKSRVYLNSCSLKKYTSFFPGKLVRSHYHINVLVLVLHASENLGLILLATPVVTKRK